MKVKSVKGALLQVLIVMVVALSGCVSVPVLPPPSEPQLDKIYLKSRQFSPPEDLSELVELKAQYKATRKRLHVLLQLKNEVGKKDIEALREVGIELLAFIPHRSWLASIPTDLDIDHPALCAVRWMGAVLPEDRLAPSVMDIIAGNRERSTNGHVALSVMYFADVDVDSLIARLDALGVHVENVSPFVRSIAILVDPQRIMDIASVDSIQWIEPVSTVRINESDRMRSFLKVDWAHNWNYTGKGVRVGIFEAYHAYKQHPDFGVPFSRLSTPMVDFPFLKETYKAEKHATHTAGMIGGDGAKSASEFGSANQWKGMAPSADLFSFRFRDNEGNTANDHKNYMEDLIDADSDLFGGIDVANNSWGDGCKDFKPGAYTKLSSFIDSAVTPANEGFFPGGGFSIVFSAGNYRNSAGCPGVAEQKAPFRNYGTLNSPKAAKNTIVVGAIDAANNAMSAYSNWGPTEDGRIKPELVASGHYGGALDQGISLIPGGEGDWCKDEDRGTYHRAPLYDPNKDSGVHNGEDNQVYLYGYNSGGVQKKAWGQSNIWVGYILKNLTDSSSCIIRSNDRWNSAFCKGSLTGGIDNDWDKLDQYSITRFYGCYGMTSAAAAATSGAIALLIEDFHKNGKYQFLPSTIKALLIHTATDLDDATTWYNRGPDYASGYGAVNIKAAIDHSHHPEYGSIIEREIGMWGHQMRYRFRVYEGMSRISATVAWDDHPATVNASKALHNDLDVTIRDPNGQLYYPWTLDPTNPAAPAVRTKPDHVNNVEQVVVEAGDLFAGDWELIVSTAKLPYYLTQDFSVIGEMLRPIPNYEKAAELKANIAFNGNDEEHERNVHMYKDVPGDFKGPEVVHKITTTDKKDILVGLSNSSMHSVFVFRDNSSFSKVLAWTSYDQSNPLAEVKDAPPGTYYIVVDSKDTSNPPYRKGMYQLMVILK